MAPKTTSVHTDGSMRHTSTCASANSAENNCTNDFLLACQMCGHTGPDQQQGLLRPATWTPCPAPSWCFYTCRGSISELHLARRTACAEATAARAMRYKLFSCDFDLLRSML